MPKNNKKDLDDIPKNILKALKFIFVNHMDQVLKVALLNSYYPKEEKLLPRPLPKTLLAQLPS
ncbi:hypothetical protein A2Y99_00965 [Candidatus Gottesmanbacteria bacterium RBG_13_37_7]|uniref:Lon proteolytic domain-containing protein n=1 Tax=Candidatus Gottesmanbacteria bacterium RBG_13_37_7 TaxID=1798369 RepID=A0A1F5YJV1_9BACT|nr:MAG: hypothetical protein A2Y99_00965 [Candidatus Gottesmanbacteria bacterium RBG_13_37_7]